MFAAFGSDSGVGVAEWLRMICVVAAVGVMTLMDGKWRCSLCGLLLLLLQRLLFKAMIMRAGKQMCVCVCVCVRQQQSITEKIGKID